MISVIIPTYNRADTLEMVLPSYFEQENVGEIIIVDDNSSVDYLNVIREFKKRYDIPLVYIKNRRNMGAAASRNVGIRCATYDMILWGEDDAFLEKSYTKVLLQYASPKNNVAICGSIYYGLLPSFTEDKREEMVNKQIEIASNKPLFNLKYFEGNYQKRVDGVMDIPFGHALLLLPKTFYDDISYFENYKVNGFREESDAQVQMVKNGKHIYYTSQTCCYHFPGNFNKKGGQHNNNRIKYEIYKILNNRIFLNRHFNFLKNKYGLKGTSFSYSLSFLFHTLYNDFAIVFRKVIGIVKGKK